MLTAKEVRELLKQNVVEVVFTKANGQERTMFCTLIDEFLPSQAELITQDRQIDDVITCWDLEQDEWRSFRLDRVISLEAEPVE